MIFKKKYKRSEWFEGLLEAEELIEDGYDVDKTQGSGYIWFKKGSSKHIGISVKDLQRMCGVLSYLEHYENKLK